MLAVLSGRTELDRQVRNCLMSDFKPQGPWEWAFWPFAMPFGLFFLIGAAALAVSFPALLLFLVPFYGLRVARVIRETRDANEEHANRILIEQKTREANREREEQRTAKLVAPAFKRLPLARRQERIELAYLILADPDRADAAHPGAKRLYARKRAYRDLETVAKSGDGAVCLLLSKLWDSPSCLDGDEWIDAEDRWQAEEHSLKWIEAAVRAGAKGAEAEYNRRLLQIERDREVMEQQIAESEAEARKRQQLADELGISLRRLPLFEKVLECVDQRSPPELALAKALVRVYKLSPRKNRFEGALRVVPQYPIKNYRVDFLIGDRLVIEVDGATYHQGREDYDLERDMAISALGYRTVRIPAREILADPDAAALRVGREWGVSKPH